MRHPHGSNSNQGSAHGGMSFYGVPPPCPLNRCGSQEPSAHGGAVSVDTTTVRVRLRSVSVRGHMVATQGCAC
eukprot:scaffold3471_cov18-Tisochrysis_lutea.AAC.1